MIGALPGAAPEPLHSSQVSWRRTVTLASVPKTASSNSMLMSSRRSAPRWVRLRRRVPAAKNLAEAEEVAEDIAEIGGVEARARASAQTGMTEAVVDAALFDIRQNGVGFAALFEFFFRVGIVGIAVGMELQRQLAIGALDLLLGGGAGYAQHLVVVAFSVAGQNGLSQILSGLMFRLHWVQCLGLRATLTIEGRSRRSFNL